MTVRYPFTINNPALPKVVSWGDALLALPSLSDWFQADTDYSTLSASDVASWSSRVASGRTFAQATASQRPTLTANQINGFPANLFENTNIDNLSMTGTLDLTGNLALVLVYKPTFSTTSQQALASSITSSSVRFGAWTATSAGGIQTFCGSGSTTIGGGYSLNAWNTLILEKDASKFQARANGVTGTELTHDNAVGSAPITLGRASGPFGGLISDVLIFNQRIIGSATTMKAINDYLGGVYGLSA